jgi:3-phenylpropionate/trans-cinnamate dioxygenase ferredoxin reductase component
MAGYKYLIVGTGMTADAAVHGIRQVDPDGAIGLIGDEADPPYSRPPLSKGLWKKQLLKHIWLINAVRHASLFLKRRIQSLDPECNQITDNQENVYEYEKLLLATGGTPRRLPFDAPGIIYFRTLNDYQRLRSLAEEKQRFAVIGGGFIGSEIAAALTMNNKNVVMIFPGQGIGERLFTADLSAFLNDFYRRKGVEMITAAEVINVEKHKLENVIKIHDVQTKQEKELTVDAVVAGLGIRPNVELARQAGLKVADGILVDSTLCTSCANIYAAGDVAEFFIPTLGKNLRVEHEDNANTMGEMAGRSMAGEAVYYERIPSFYSDLFELGFEAVGEIDTRLETVADWIEPFRKGVVYYLRENLVRGVLLWNVWGQVDAARALIAEKGPLRPLV